MANQDYKEEHCPFCGRIVRDTDKFCIFCGKPLKKREPSPAAKEIPEQERKELEKEVDDELGFMSESVARSKSGEDSKSKPFTENKSDETEAESEEEEVKDKSTSEISIPEDVKNQLEIKMQLALLGEKKIKLKKKLEELMSNLDEEKYEWDMDYAEQINLKLNAFKELKNEMLEKENELREQLGGSFRMDRLKEEVALKREQLVELKRSYKRRKIKKDVYKQLKEEYVEEFEKDKNELEELQKQLVRWLSREKGQKSRIETKMRILEGRFNSHEINKKEYEEGKKELKNEIEKVKQRISILENYTETPKRKWF